MEFLVGIEINVPGGTPQTELADLEHAEAAAAAKLAADGRLLRLWTRPRANGEAEVLGLYRADSKGQLEGILGTLPIAKWMNVTIDPLEPHPNDPLARRPSSKTNGSPAEMPLPEPSLTLIYRLEATLGHPLDVGDTAHGHRRIVAQTGGTFTGPAMTGKLLPGASADWQLVLQDGTALADLRYTLQSDQGALLYVRSRGVRHGPAEVLARLGRGENVDASEYTFRLLTQIETASPELDWLNKGLFITVGGREPDGVIYETYLVG